MTAGRGGRAAGAWRAALAAALVGALCAPAFAGELREQRFELRHHTPDEAYRVVAPHLSERAEVRILRTERALVVRDEPERLSLAAAAVAEFDVALRRVSVRVRAVKGERREVPQPVSEAAAGVPVDVRELLAYNSFEELGEVEIEVAAGGDVSRLLGPDGELRVSLTLGAVDPVHGTIALDSLALERRRRGADGAAVYRPVVRFSEELASGKPRVLFATPGPGDRRALILVITGTIAGGG